jgi:hypothetical protein
MANTPEKQQIVPEDFKKEEQELASKIAQPFNTYVDQLDEILNRNLTFGDNLRCDLRTLQVTAGTPVTFKYAQSGKPIGMWVINYSDITDPSAVPTTAVQPQWSYDGRGNITINNVTGLTASHKYNITIIAISG